MFFRRNAGKYHETDRVTRFKLIKSGKTGFVQQLLTLDFSKLLEEVQMRRLFSAQSVEEKHRFSQVKHY